jgi:hypothetical protein
MNDFFDFNDAGEQKTFDLIPDNTIATVQISITPGAAGDNGWLTRAKDGASEHVNCVLTVVDGKYAKSKIFARYTVSGTTPGHEEAKDISRNTFRAIIESVRGIRPDDESDAAKAARQTHGWADFDQLRFMARIGVIPPKDGHAAKNTIREIITPEHTKWMKVEQIDRNLPGKTNGSGAPAQQPVNVITRPTWAQPDQPEQPGVKK